MDDERIRRIFRPFYQRRLRDLAKKQARFAYYTSATTGMNILKGQTLWLRAAACMNDYREIGYGIQMLNQAIYSSAQRRARIERLAGDLHWDGEILPRLLGDMNQDEQDLITHTYLACVSEYDRGDGWRGRLSMWRAYGRKTGVALVLKAGPFLQSAQKIPLRWLPS